ncbi:MAG: bifunctional helix-turn-helix transcriptional regulator/GNAT family N-acetyltransferase [Polyangiales bacterium]
MHMARAPLLDLGERIEAIRAFNRFWTAHIGVLRGSHLETPYSLTEARVIFELAQREVTELADLRAELRIDPGYLSRIVAQFRAAKLMVTEPSPKDGRRQLGRLTPKGRRAFELLDARSIAQVKSTLAPLDDATQTRLVAALDTARSLFAPPTKAPRAFVLRSPAPGDYGWIVERHGALYAAEYGWDETFEGLVAEIVAAFAKKHDAREATFIAEVEGERAGCVMCVRKNAKTAQLRLLLVDPRHRGHGLGGRLVEECIRFAERAGYAKLVLWTNDVLKDARRLYEKAGFELVEEEKHESFGKKLVGQTWAKSLR